MVPLSCVCDADVLVALSSEISRQMRKLPAMVNRVMCDEVWGMEREREREREKEKGRERERERDLLTVVEYLSM